MGYSTEFTGHVTVTPPLNPAEAAYLYAFSECRRQTTPEGPYTTKEYGFGQRPAGVIDFPPEGQPSRWCDWAPTEDATGIQWNGTEKFDESVAWMQYLIDHFLKPGAEAQGLPGFEEFTFDHVVNGEIAAQGDMQDDVWRLVVTANVVTKVEVEAPRQRLAWLIAEYRALRACSQPVAVDMMDEIAALSASVRAADDDEG